MRIRAFRGYRPDREKAGRIASRPYDVLTTEEAGKEADGNPYSFLKVSKPEIGFPADTDPCSPDVYRAAARNFQAWVDDGTFVRDENECLYLYEMIMEGRARTGIVAAAAVRDYLAGRIKKHELTRHDKEADRANHIRATMLNVEPVMFVYRYDREIDVIVASVKEARPEYEFTDEDEVRHRFRVIHSPEIIDALIGAFAEVPASYVADGHHRTAAAALVSRELNARRSQDAADSAHDYFLAVHFPDNQLEILDYNRLVGDLNGLDTDAFLQALGDSFSPHRTGKQPVRPKRGSEIGMYLAGNWYRLSLRPDRYAGDDVVAALGVSVLSEHILQPILGIHDLRTDRRIRFVGGVRGPEELEKSIDRGEMAVAFTLCPVSVQQLMSIADQGEILPPKATWFEPKLRSGLVVYSLKD